MILCYTPAMLCDAAKQVAQQKGVELHDWQLIVDTKGSGRPIMRVITPGGDAVDEPIPFPKVPNSVEVTHSVPSSLDKPDEERWTTTTVEIDKPIEVHAGSPQNTTRRPTIVGHQMCLVCDTTHKEEYPGAQIESVWGKVVCGVCDNPIPVAVRIRDSVNICQACLVLATNALDCVDLVHGKKTSEYAQVQ